MVFSLADAVVMGHKHFHVMFQKKYSMLWLKRECASTYWSKVDIFVCAEQGKTSGVGLTTCRQNIFMAYALVWSNFHHLTVNSILHFPFLCKPITSLHTVFIRFPFLFQHTLKWSLVLIQWTSIFQFNKETKWGFFNYSLCLGFRTSLHKTEWVDNSLSFH